MGVGGGPTPTAPLGSLTQTQVFWDVLFKEELTFKEALTLKIQMNRIT